MSSFCIGSISWCYFVLLVRWCSPVSADPLFPSDLKFADVAPVYKKTPKNSKDNLNQQLYYPIFPKFTKDVFMIKFSSFSILYCPISIRVLQRLKRTTLLDKHNWQKEENYYHYYYYCYYYYYCHYYYYFFHVMNLVS